MSSQLRSLSWTLTICTLMLLLVVPVASAQGPQDRGLSLEKVLGLRNVVLVPIENAPSNEYVWKDGAFTKVSSQSFLVVRGGGVAAPELLKDWMSQDPRAIATPQQRLEFLRQDSLAAKALEAEGVEVVGVATTSCEGTCTNNCGVIGCDLSSVTTGQKYCTPCNCIKDASSTLSCSTCTCKKISTLTENQ